MALIDTKNNFEKKDITISDPKSKPATYTVTDDYFQINTYSSEANKNDNHCDQVLCLKKEGIFDVLKIWKEEYPNLFNKEELFFTIKTKDEQSVNDVLALKKSVEFSGLNVLSDSLKIGQTIFIVFGGDKPKWETGLVAIATLSKLPYDFEGKNFKVQADIKILLSKPLKRSDFVLYPETHDIIGIGPITKWEPNQALSQVSTEKAYGLLNAIYNIDYDKQNELELFFTPEQMKLITSNHPKFALKNVKTKQNKKIILDKIKKYQLNKENISYRNYTKSLITKPFTILAGNSGTGKTKIAKDLATYLGKHNPNNPEDIQNKLIVPVGSDWTDNTKILGFYNPLKKTYESTKILDFILLARDNPEIPFFLILDEMNLSHVERYFSDFLSAMESHEKIILYSKDVECDSDIPDMIDLPENLFVTGTVNIDETTYMFSPKVLDRANVIEFIPEQSDVLANFESETQLNEITPVNDGSAEGFLALAKEVRETTMLPAGADVCKNILEGISNILQGSGFEFAFRTAKEIRLYINVAYALAQNEGKTLDESDYVNLMDEQLLQKILPKIHGNRSQVGVLLKNLSDFCDSKTVKYNDKDISGYNLPNSKIKINRMLKQLETTQFTSFI